MNEEIETTTEQESSEANIFEPTQSDTTDSEVGDTTGSEADRASEDANSVAEVMEKVKYNGMLTTK